DAVVGLVAPEAPDPRAEAEREGVDAHLEQARREEVPQLVDEDQEADAQRGEEDRAEVAGHAYLAAAAMRAAAWRRTRRSVSSIASSPGSGRFSKRSSASATTPWMPVNGRRPARKASTATSLAALRIVPESPPARATRCPSSRQGKACVSGASKLSPE